MRIAFISYEYAGTATGGGIGTYVRNAARMLAARGHEVEVFTGSVPADPTPQPGLHIHGAPGPREGFAHQIVPVFAARHGVAPFDVIEGPEYGADAQEVQRQFPHVPLVVRLHAAGFSIYHSNRRALPWSAGLMFTLGALRRGRWAVLPRYDWRTDPERDHALTADLILANSKSTAAYTARTWHLPDAAVETLRYVFEPPPAMLACPPAPEATEVLFLGRLEMRKGVLDLARAIPKVLRQRPETRFRFVGRSLPHPWDGQEMADHIRTLAGPDAADRIEITGPVPYDHVPTYMAQAAICCFPSDWEASGFVCMEAMAAARGVIGSSSGGMAEIIEPGKTGLLVPPRSPNKIAKAILRMLANPEERVAMGQAARAHVSTAYGPDNIGPLQEQAYDMAITRAKARGQSM